MTKNAFNILLQDIDYCIQAFSINDFTKMNTAANRIMENCLFFDNYKLLFPAVILKDVSNDYLGILQDEIKRKLLVSAKVIGEDLIKVIRENFNENINEKLIWKKFHDFTIGISEFHKDNLEDEVYQENLEFADLVFQYLITHLKNNKEELYKPFNNILDGIINVMIRVIKNHSCRLEHTMVYLYIKFFVNLYNYALLNSQTEDDDIIDISKMKKELEPYVNYITNDFKFDVINYEEFDKKIWNMGRRFRELYLIVKIPPRQVPIPSRVLPSFGPLMPFGIPSYFEQPPDEKIDIEEAIKDKNKIEKENKLN